MKKLFLSSVLFFFTFCVFPDRIETLTVVHTNDLHAYLQPDTGRAGFARIAAFFKKIRREKKNVIILDAGDCITGTPVSAFYKGIPVFDVMALMGYDVQVLGNHEFDWGYKQINEFKKRVSYPIICANAYSPEGQLIADSPYVNLNINGIKVSVIGIISEITADETKKSGNIGVKFLSEIETAEKLVPQLKNKCDFLIMLTHIGLENDKLLADAVKGINLIVGGHSHSLLKTPYITGDTYIVQAGCNGRYVGVATVKINITTRKVLNFTYRVYRPSDLPQPDKNVERLVDKWENEVTRKVDYKIGIATHTLSPVEMKALIQKILKEKADTDFGYYNHGGIRDKIYKGAITARRIWNIEPFGNTIVIATIQGKNIGGVLLRSLREKQFKIIPDKYYTVATNNYVGERPGRFIGKPSKIDKTGFSVRQTIIDYIKNKGSL